jgi:membrane protease YdiL (CAAX protease family)
VLLATLVVGLLSAAQVGFRHADAALGLALGALGTSSAMAALALGTAGLARRPPRGIRARLDLGPGRLSALGLAALVLGTLGLSHSLDTAVALLDLADDSILGEIDSALTGARGARLGAVLVGLALAPGIAEELLFRGLLQGALLRRWKGRRGGVAGAIGLASLAFGFVHGDPVHAVAAFFLGLYLGVVAWRAGSIRASILAHVVNNGLAVLAGSLAPEALGGGTAPSVWWLAPGLALAALALWRVPRPPDPPRPSPGPPDPTQPSSAS